MCAHQLLNLTGSTVEGPGQAGHFVVAFHGDTRGEITRAERFNAPLQALETTGELPNDGKGAHGDRRGQQHQHDVEDQP